MRQTVVLRRGALTSGRGNFRVDPVRVNLTGSGYAETREGRLRGFAYPNTDVVLQAKGMQAGPAGLMENMLVHEIIWSEMGTYATPVTIEIGTRMFPCDFDILNPDVGGSEPWLYVTLITSAWAEYEDAYALIDLSRGTYDGMEMCCVSLFGNYV